MYIHPIRIRNIRISPSTIFTGGSEPVGSCGVHLVANRDQLSHIQLIPTSSSPSRLLAPTIKILRPVPRGQLKVWNEFARASPLNPVGLVPKRPLSDQLILQISLLLVFHITPYN